MSVPRKNLPVRNPNSFSVIPKCKSLHFVHTLKLISDTKNTKNSDEDDVVWSTEEDQWIVICKFIFFAIVAIARRSRMCTI